MPREQSAFGQFLGGQDSTAYLADALKRNGRVETIGVDDGQRQRIALQLRSVLLDRLRSEF